MAQCPKCQTPIAVDFGIYTCTVCDSVLFIDMSGNVQLDSQNKSEDSLAVPSFSMPSAPEVSPSTAPQTSTQFAPMLDLGNMQAPVSQPEYGNQGMSPLPEPPPQIMRPPAPPVSADLSEIAKFGNSETSLGKDGPYIYDVLIWNIDSKEIRESLRAALKDRRFGWDAERIMTTIKQGAMRIPQLNAVKAAVLINRIKNLPLGISWEQSLHTDSTT